MKARGFILLLSAGALVACSDSDTGSAGGSDVSADGIQTGDSGPDDVGADLASQDFEVVAFCFGQDDGTPCDDGNGCTLDDECSSGVCVGGTTKICDAEGPCRPGSCDAGTGACVYEQADDGTPCSVACFLGATCQEGECVATPGTGISCPTPDNPCVDQLKCDSTTGQCTVEIYKEPGDPCDTDDDLCTIELCSADGECLDTGTEDTCAEESAANPCWTFTCTEKTGCMKTLFIEGVSCNDKNPCTVADKCAIDQFNQKACIGTPVNTDDKNACTDDACAGGQVTHTPIPGVICELADPCSPVGECSAAGKCEAQTPCECQVDADCPAPTDLCVGALMCDTSGDVPECVPDPDEAVVCPAPSGPCKEVDCDPATGACTESDAPNGSLCDDGSACTQDDACQAGACVGTPVACDDGNLCNGVETCDPAGGCAAGTAPDLDDGVACTVDGCDPDAGVTHLPDDAACDDGDWCNGAETCDPAAGCQAGTAPDLDDGVACTVDSCDEATDSVVHTPDDGLCPDDDLCDGVDFCDASAGCQAGPTPPIDDGVACTVDACDPALGVTHTPDDASCQDGDFCNGQEVCDLEKDCGPGTPPELDDGIGCTVDTCDEDADAIVHTPDDAACDDGEFCNGVELCSASLDCVDGIPVPVDDGVYCTNDSCDEDNDVVVHLAEDARCDNGLWCDGAETCDPVADCQDGTAPPKDDGIPCTIDLCDEPNDQILHTPDNGQCPDGQLCDPSQGCIGGAPLDPNGNWSLSPGIAYSCAFGLVSLNYPQFSFSDSGTSLTVQQFMNGGCQMQGDSAYDGTFSVSCQYPGTCTEIYTLTGQFSDNDTWSGTWTVNFVGTCFGCTYQEFDITGTRL